MKFLLVDDDVISRMILSDILKPIGDVQEASSAHEAMTIIMSLPDVHHIFNGIFLDLSMPGMNGMECLHEIRKFEAEMGLDIGEGFKIIMATSNSDEESISASFSKQCDGYVTKPFEKEEIMQAMRLAEILT